MRDECVFSDEVTSLIDGLPAMVSVKRAAKVSGCSVSTLKRLHRAGRLRFVKFNHGGSARCFVPRTELAKFFATLMNEERIAG